MGLKTLSTAAMLLALSTGALAGAPPKGWLTKGPKDNLERVHRATGLSCSIELLPDMNLKAYGAAKSVAPGKPFCEYERSGDHIRVYVLGRSATDPNAIKAMTDAVRNGDIAKQGYPVFQSINVVSKDSETPWSGVAFDLSKGQSQTPKIASVSFAAINGWDVRLDIDYTVMKWKDPGAKSQEPELRDAMAYLLAATLKKKK